MSPALPRPEVISSSVARSRARETFSAFSRRSKAALTSKARSLTGNTRFPRSVFSGTPMDAKNAMVSRPSNREKALYKNLPFRGTLASKVCTSALLVTLHRPLPVMFSFFPSRSLGSSSVTRAPRSAAETAAIPRRSLPAPYSSSIFPNTP